MSLCVQLAGRSYVVSGNSVDADKFIAGVSSYDPRTDQWKSESPLPIGNYGAASVSSGLRAVTHEGRLVVLPRDQLFSPALGARGQRLDRTATSPSRPTSLRVRGFPQPITLVFPSRVYA